jgi:hypothetical protein
VAETVTDTHRTIDAIWRIEQAKLIAVLARIVRDVGLAEDLAQGRTRRRTRTVIQVKYPGEGATPDRAPSTTSIPDLYDAATELASSPVADLQTECLGACFIGYEGWEAAWP